MKTVQPTSYLVVGVLVAVASVAHLFSVGAPAWLALGPGLLPLLGGILMHALKRNAPASSESLRALVMFGVLVLWGGAHSFVLFTTLIADTRDVDRYAHYREAPELQGLLAHFPATIPDDAHEVAFFFQPGFLQGGTSIQLRFKASPTTIAGYAKAAAQNATGSSEKLDAGDASMEGYLWRMPYVRVPEGAPSVLPTTFEIFFLNPPVDEKDWNHPTFWGIAVDRRAGEVLFWAHDA